MLLLLHDFVTQKVYSRLDTFFVAFIYLFSDVVLNFSMTWISYVGFMRSKYWKISKHGYERNPEKPNYLFQGKGLEQVSDFIYLWSIISECGKVRQVTGECKWKKQEKYVSAL